MLELKTYSIQEMRTIFNSETKQQINRKLVRYGVEYMTNGAGQSTEYTITRINDPFKLFCIIELEFPAQSDFNHLRRFMYHFFCDDYFMSMPDETKELLMDEAGYHISRQTIAKYVKRLAQKNYISTSGEYYYYFSYKGRQQRTTAEKYREAWRYYWEMRGYGADAIDAMGGVVLHYGGVPKKQHLAEKNAFYLKHINYLIELITIDTEKDLR